MPSSSSSADLETVLGRSRDLGFLGPGPVAEHIEHAHLFRLPLESLRGGAGGAPVVVVDLGAGGGVPSLPLLVRDPALKMVLVDSSQRRISFLVWAAVELGLADRVEVWAGRAEDFARLDGRRGIFDAAVARSFGPPSITLECGAPLVRPGGLCVVSDPPGGRRWSVEALAELGLSVGPASDRVAVFERTGDIDERYPRNYKAQKRSPVPVLDG